jgi:hypothetical protein
VRFLFAEAKRQYAAKVKAGTLSPDGVARFQQTSAKFAELERAHEALTARIAAFRYQTGSNSIQPNQTHGNKTQ